MYLAIRDRVMFVSTGTGLMALLTDGDIDDIIDEMKPLLKVADYDGAAEHGVKAMRDVLSGV